MNPDSDNIVLGIIRQALKIKGQPRQNLAEVVKCVEAQIEDQAAKEYKAACYLGHSDPKEPYNELLAEIDQAIRYLKAMKPCIVEMRDHSHEWVGDTCVMCGLNGAS